MDNLMEWIEDEPEYVGPHDEGETFFSALVQAAHAGHGMWSVEAEQVAKIAFQLQVDTIVWLYEADMGYIEEFGLPSVEEAEAWYRNLGLSDIPSYGTTDAIKFAEWVLENQAEDWREQSERKYLEERLARLKK